MTDLHQAQPDPRLCDGADLAMNVLCQRLLALTHHSLTGLALHIVRCESRRVNLLVLTGQTP